MGKGYAEHENGGSHSAERPDLQTRLLFEEAPQRPPVPIPPLLGGEKTQEPRRMPHAVPYRAGGSVGSGREKQVGAAPGTPGGADAALQVPGGLCSVHGAEPASLGS